MTFTKPKPVPYGPFVGSQNGAIIQKAQFEDCQGIKAQECSEQNFGPIGTGPYKVKEFRPNDTVVFEINENYRDPDKPYFSEVVIKGGGDAAAAARAVLETGEADYAWNTQVEPQILDQMEVSRHWYGGYRLRSWRRASDLQHDQSRSSAGRTALRVDGRGSESASVPE